MEPSDYLARTTLQTEVATIRDCQRQLWGVLEDARHRSLPAIPSAMDRYYRYKVPKLSPDGSCSLHEELEKEPYDLAAVLGGRDPRATATLLTLDSYVEFVLQTIGASWLGIYQVRTTPRGLALVKLASKGKPSRAEFPLTPAFAKKSSNVRVAMTGVARVIADVRAHVAAGGEYYECDPNTRSEACLPILEARGVVGVVDAEHSTAKHFTNERQAWLAALALELPAVMPVGGAVAPAL